VPCIFCVAVLLIIGALTSEGVDQIEAKLRSKAEDGEVRRTVESESVVKFDLTVSVDSEPVPVAVTVFKDPRRVRIQVLTHELSPEEVEQLEDELAEVLDAEIVDRSDPAHEAGADHAAEHAASGKREARPRRPTERRPMNEGVAPRRKR
jgi:hypothetical protein